MDTETLTVRELIKALSAYDPNSPVYVNAFDAGLELEGVEEGTDGEIYLVAE